MQHDFMQKEIRKRLRVALWSISTMAFRIHTLWHSRPHSPEPADHVPIKIWPKQWLITLRSDYRMSVTSTVGMAFHHWLQRACYNATRMLRPPTAGPREMDVSLLLTLYEPGNGFSLSYFCPHQVFWYSFQKASSFHGNRASSFQVAWGWTQWINGPQAAIWLPSRYFTCRCRASWRNTEDESSSSFQTLADDLSHNSLLLCCLGTWPEAPWQQATSLPLSGILGASSTYRLLSRKGQCPSLLSFLPLSWRT